ncbi:hypothetical protein H3N56_03375 [Cetobacterium sp. 2A]|uniref:hypothetical protein n=1 Tax=unclassified Cetobacterium TaxID=2630983 RepID=UPI00163C7228|nr:hypothetical protein [Cetobacterium sp. 2A]MBC2855536.1 hypothetical protein [Cetobacterium sp. 2A]
MKKTLLGLMVLLSMTAYSNQDETGDSATINMSGFVYGELEISVEKHMEFGDLRKHTLEKPAYSVIKIKDSTLSDNETSIAKISIDETATLQNTKHPESQYTINLSLVDGAGVLPGASFKDAKVTVSKTGREYEVTGRVDGDVANITPGTYSGNFNIKATYEI